MLLRRIALFSLVFVLALSGCEVVRAASFQEGPERPNPEAYSATLKDKALLDLSPMVVTPPPREISQDIRISLLGDCTLGQQRDTAEKANSFQSVVGSDYDHPFRYAREYLQSDDLTLINLEGALTAATDYRDKEFTFKGLPEYARILSLSGIEAVNLANNHTFDYKEQGLADTKAALSSENILWSNSTEYAIFEKGDISIGMAGFSFPPDAKGIETAIDELRVAGCTLVIISLHGGTEAAYEPDGHIRDLAHAAIDLGADLVVGHHPHRLQPIEEYKGKYILYSLGNFVFGGQPWLTDLDTAIIQCHFQLENGYVVKSQLTIIPFSMSSGGHVNNYQPIPYDTDSEGYGRVLAKLKMQDDQLLSGEIIDE